VLPITFALATSNYEYGPDEYVTVANGISPDGQYAITAHGAGKLGDDNFHLYLMDASTGKNLGSLEEIVETLDTGADAFSAKWSTDSKEVIIIYRVDRHAPLKAVTYTIADRRALHQRRRRRYQRRACEVLARPFFCPCSLPEDIWHTSSPWLNV
jgi:hypothetical protein